MLPFLVFCGVTLVTLGLVLYANKTPKVETEVMDTVEEAVAPTEQVEVKEEKQVEEGSPV